LAAFRAEQPTGDAPGHLVAWLAPRQPVYAHRMRGRRLDIGDPESYRAAAAWLVADR
jgi:UTP-glucose-1-phosphate uridylyltransferase